jgi:DNA-binding XRE family transcriptional regulator
VFVDVVQRRRNQKRVHQYESAEYRALQARFTVNLRRIRHAANLTQEQAAMRCGMLMQRYQQIESGTSNVTFATLARVASGLMVDLSELFAEPRAMD